MTYLEDKTTASYGLDYAPGEQADSVEQTEQPAPAPDSQGIGATLARGARAVWGAWVRYSVLNNEYGRQWPY